MKKRIYIITGAAGHLGSTLVRMLAQKGEDVRGLLLPEEKGLLFPTVTYFHGDVRDVASLRPLFTATQGNEVILIHCAGIISIAEQATQQMLEVNVQGTQNIIDICKAFVVDKLVYVSSVHAIAEGEPWRVIAEAERFSPEWVEGGYAKTKAMATQRVLDAAEDINVTVVHPSGIIGPYDATGNHLVQMIADYVHGKLPAGVKGGYDFVDVRDVAEGCLAAADVAESGQCFILSNRYYTVKEVLRMLRHICGGRRVPILPIWMARAAAPLLSWVARLRKERPLYTRYSLYTLASNGKFSHDKATRVLGFCPRDLWETLGDTVRWLEKEERKVQGTVVLAK